VIASGPGERRVTSRILPLVTLVLGGARSGKSAYAERLIEAASGSVGETGGLGLYLATAEAGDREMADRISWHRARRGDAWMTVEEPLELAAALRRYSDLGRPVLVDCLTLWLSNVMAAGRDVDAEVAVLTQALGALGGSVVLVSNEVGLGLVPATPLGRAFRDHAGRLNQAVAEVADRVIFVAAGLPLTLKDAMQPPADGTQ
jgi:adenosylcobinamide kinase / adenosylcobinamide-phosphate guanylyltransferase